MTIDSNSNYVAQELNDYFYTRRWHKESKIHAYGTEHRDVVQIQWSFEGRAEVVEANPEALQTWLHEKHRRWTDLEILLIRKLKKGHTPKGMPRQQNLPL